MTDKFNLLKNIRFSIISFSINIVLIFVSYRMVIHYNGIEGLGLWSLLMAWASLIRMGDIGMGGAIVRFISMRDLDEEREEIAQYIDTGLIMNFMMFLMLTLVGYLVLELNLSNIVDKEYYIMATNILPIMFMGIFFSTLFTILVSSLQGLHVGYIGSYITVIGSLIQLLFVFILVPKIGVLGLVWAQLLQYIIVTVIAFLFVKNKIGIKRVLRFDFSWIRLKEMFSFSIKAQVANIINGLFEPLSKILISQFGGLSSQGLYELAYKTVSLARNTVVTGLFASLPTLTNLMNTNLNEAKLFYKKSQKNVLKAISIVLLLVIILSPFISLVWMGNFDNDYWYFVVFLSIGFWINTLGATAYNIGMATGKMKNNIISSIVLIISLIIFGYILGNIFAEIGVVIAVGTSLAFSGLLIKKLNERMINGR
jgi:O-antigen/teichoic acid export membrane protein